MRGPPARFAAARRDRAAPTNADRARGRTDQWRTTPWPSSAGVRPGGSRPGGRRPCGRRRPESPCNRRITGLTAAQELQMHVGRQPVRRRRCGRRPPGSARRTAHRMNAFRRAAGRPYPDVVGRHPVAPRAARAACSSASVVRTLATVPDSVSRTDLVLQSTPASRSAPRRCRRRARAPARPAGRRRRSTWAGPARGTPRSAVGRAA